MIDAFYLLIKTGCDHISLCLTGVSSFSHFLLLVFIDRLLIVMWTVLDTVYDIMNL